MLGPVPTWLGSPVLTRFRQSPDTRQWSYMCQLRRESADKLLSQVIPLIPQNQWHLGKMGMPQLSAAPMKPLSLLLQATQPSLNLGLL